MIPHRLRLKFVYSCAIASSAPRRPARRITKREKHAEDRSAPVVDDRGARHTLTLEPLITATTFTQFESDLAEVFLGGSVVRASDVNGDVHADGMPGAEACDHPRGV